VCYYRKQYLCLLLSIFIENSTKLCHPLNVGQGWEDTVVKQEQSDESQAEMKISLPSMPSLYIISFLFRACEEIHRIGGHVLDKSILQKFASSLLEKVCNLAGQLTLLVPQTLF